MCAYDFVSDWQTCLSYGVSFGLLLQKAEELHEREKRSLRQDGEIVDAKGKVLAANKTVCTISVIHSQIKEPEKVIEILSEKLGMDEGDCAEKSRKNFFY